MNNTIQVNKMQYEALTVAMLGGAIVGILGALVGVGGGFIVVPMMAMLAPSWSASELTGPSRLINGDT